MDGDAQQPSSIAWRLTIRYAIAWLPFVVMVFALGLLRPRVIEIRIDPAMIVAEHGFLRSAPLPLSARRGAAEGILGSIERALLRAAYVTEGDEGASAHSTLVPFVSARPEGMPRTVNDAGFPASPLGPAHVAHDTIAAEGRGRYSHWGSRLFFSWPDEPAKPVVRSGPPPPPHSELRLDAVWTAPARGWTWIAVIGGLLLALADGLRRTARILAETIPLRRARRRIAMLGASAVAFGGALALSSSAAASIAWWTPPIVVIGALVVGAVATVGTALGGRRASAASARPHPHFRAARREAAGRRVVECALVPLCLLVSISTVVAARDGRMVNGLPGAGFAIRAAIPLSDTSSYAAAAEAFTVGAPMPAVASRRPLLVAAQGAILELTGSASAALVAQAVLLAMALAALGLAMAPRFGACAAFGAPMAALAWMQGTIATNASESLGCAFGAVALALLVLGTTRRSSVRGAPAPTSIALGAFALFAMALSALVRPGAVFAVITVAAAVVVTARRGRRLVAAISAAAALGAAAAIPSIVSFALGSFGGSANANLSHTLLGIACGSDWHAAEERFSAELAAIPNEREQSAWRLSKAFELARESPGVFVGSLWRGFSGGVKEIPADAWHWSRVPGAITSLFGPPAEIGAVGSLDMTKTRWKITAWVLAALWIGAACTAFWRGRRDATVIVLAAWAIGILLSLPIIWTDGGWRSLAGSAPLLATLFVLPAWALRRANATNALAPPHASARAPARRSIEPERPRLAGAAGVVLALSIVVLGIVPFGVNHALGASAARGFVPRVQATRTPFQGVVIELGPETSMLPGVGPSMEGWPSALAPVFAAVEKSPDAALVLLVDRESGTVAPALAPESFGDMPPGRYAVFAQPLGGDAAPWRRIVGWRRIGAVE